MAIPLAVAGSAALLAGGAWLNAKTQFGYDFTLISGFLNTHLQIKWKHKHDRLNLFYTLEEHAKNKRTANRSFIQYEGKSWTFKEVYDIVLKYGTWLKTIYAIAPQEVVAMDFMNSPQFIFLWMGIWSLGARPAFINYNLTGDPLLHSVKTSTARILFVEDELRPQFTQNVIDTLASPEIRDGKGPVQTVYFDSALERHIYSIKGMREPDSSRSGITPPDMANLIYTSGTTGLPKAAVVSWQKCLLGGHFMPHWMGLKKTDVYYTCMPLYHSSAALLAFCPCLVNGNTLAIGRRFSTKTFWPEVRLHRATIIQYVGETCRYLLAAPPQFDPVSGHNLDRDHKVRVAFGNGLRPDVWERFKTRFAIETIAEFYSATEGVSATWNLSSNTLTTGAIGRNGPLTSFLLKYQLTVIALDPHSDNPLRNPRNHNLCTPVRPGQPGELLFKLDPKDTHSKYQGYYNNTAATESKILRDVLVPGDAYFRTDDILRWDAQGRWYFHDRIGDTFRWKSENVSTAEVGSTLGAHPKILEANVYGVEVPHHDGRAGCAAVLFEGEITADLLADVAIFAGRNLPKYAAPSFLRVVSEVVATGNNKQQKARLRGEGVEPGRVGADSLFWLRGDRYVPFGEREWRELSGGRVRL